MKVIQISLSYQRTHNMGNYSNIKPTINLVADVDENDAPEMVIHKLNEMAKQHVHDFIDRELERDDQPPYFYSGQRYKLAKFTFEKLAIIIPQEVELSDNWAQATTIYYDQRRFDNLVDLIAKKYPDYEMIDARTPGAATFLSELIKVTILDRAVGDVKYTIFLPGHLYRRDLPGEWDSYSTKVNTDFAFPVQSRGLSEIAKNAEAQGGIVLNLLEEGIKGLPDLPKPEPEPQPETYDAPSEDYYDPFDDDDDDEDFI